jgi:hypothetical protein
MVNVIKSVITAGGYKLADVQHKIKKMYMFGDITEAEMDELLSLAADGVSSDAERPEVLAMLKSLSDKIDALTARVTVLEGGEEPEPEYPAWEPWDGISDKYQKGAIVTHKGAVWESIFNGQNVWEPGTQGTESMWVLFD